MYEVHINVSETPYTYVWETVAKFRNRCLAWEECEKWRERGFWAIVKETDVGAEICRELNREAKAYSKRCNAEFTNWQKDSYGTAEIYSVRIEAITEAYSEYVSAKAYW